MHEAQIREPTTPRMDARGITPWRAAARRRCDAEGRYRTPRFPPTQRRDRCATGIATTEVPRHRSCASSKRGPKPERAAMLRGTVMKRWAAGRGARRASRERPRGSNNPATCLNWMPPRATRRKRWPVEAWLSDVVDRALTLHVTGAPR